MGCAFTFALTLAFAQTAEPPKPANEVNVATIVARVDDKVILLQDAVGPIKPRLEEMRRALPADEYARQERAILKQAVDRLIDRAVLLKEVDLKLKDPKRVDDVRKQIALEFEKNLYKMARDQGLKSKEELLRELEKEGASLELHRQNFVDDNLAREFLRQHLMPLVANPTRAEMEAWHRDHAQQFQQNAGVVWRHIEVRIGADPKAAAEKIHKAQERLTAGEDFAAVAKELSEDATASVGGLCPLTSKGSYYEPLVDEALFSMPVGRFSTPLRGKDAFHIVKVEKRNSDGVKPFTEVQREIAAAIREERMKDLQRTKMAELKKRHFIESIFDKPEVAGVGQGKTVR
jgi:parvulin-like peptidyl-prolyl isomerase